MNTKPRISLRTELLYPLLSPGPDEDPVLNAALDLAEVAHRKQTRWTPAGRTPYLLHPLNVFFRLRAWGVTDQTILAAALLHDTVEDAPAIVCKSTTPPPGSDLGPTVEGAIAGIAHTFNPAIAEVVSGLTNRDDVPYLDHVAEATRNAPVLIVKLSDVTHNALSLGPTHPRYEKLRGKYAPLLPVLADRLRENTAAHHLLPAWEAVLDTLR